MGEPVKYVAMRRGFVDGNRVYPGDKFMWSGKPPSWAKPAAENPMVPEPQPLGGDTKPLNTQMAVKRKAEGLPAKGVAF